MILTSPNVIWSGAGFVSPASLLPRYWAEIHKLLRFSGGGRSGPGDRTQAVPRTSAAPGSSALLSAFDRRSGRVRRSGRSTANSSRRTVTRHGLVGPTLRTRRDRRQWCGRPMGSGPVDAGPASQCLGHRGESGQGSVVSPACGMEVVVEHTQQDVGAMISLTPEQYRRAALVVCGHARDRDDAAELLDALGLRAALSSHAAA